MSPALLPLLLSLACQDPASATTQHDHITTISLSPSSQRVLTCAGLSPEELAFANNIKAKMQELRSLQAQVAAERLAVNAAIAELTLLSDSLTARVVSKEQKSEAKPNQAAKAAQDLKKEKEIAAKAKATHQDPAALVTVIERMKPAKAASVMRELDPDLAKEIVRRMKPAKAAKLLSVVDDNQAAAYASALVKKQSAGEDEEDQP